MSLTFVLILILYLKFCFSLYKNDFKLRLEIQYVFFYTVLFDLQAFHIQSNQINITHHITTLVKQKQKIVTSFPQKSQASFFQDNLYQGARGKSTKHESGNFRPTQPLNGRIVYRS